MIKNLLFAMSILLTVFCADAKPKLADYRKNIYSQFGEDGILEKIFEKIGIVSKVAIEFGAADGFGLSNTANFWSKDLQWLGVLIEYDQQLFQQAVKNTAPFNCKVLHRKVGFSATDSLEAILKQEQILVNAVDLLSIDIDGNDYYVFQSLEYLRPRVIICEYNVSIPAHLDLYTDPDNYMGCSVAALQRVAAAKGYTLVAITDSNCFFVVNEEMPKLAEFDIDCEHIKIDTYLSYIITDYAGCYKVVGDTNFINPWGWAQRPSRYSNKGVFKFLPVTVTKN